MSEKRARVAVSAVDDDSPCKKRGHTIKKWVVEYEKELTTTLWLTYDRLERDHVSALKCKVCIQFEDQLTSTRNFNRTFISGSTNFRVSTVKDHASSAMHQRAMLL